jgi:hypothetical protein
MKLPAHVAPAYVVQCSDQGRDETVDPEAARKAEEEAEERRLAELRSHGVMVTPQTFSEWKQHFDAKMAMSRYQTATPTLHLALFGALDVFYSSLMQK